MFEVLHGSFRKCALLFCAIFLTIWKQNHPLKWIVSFFFHPMSANCVHAENVSQRENFLYPNFSKFAVECDWNSKVSLNVQNFGLFLEN